MNEDVATSFYYHPRMNKCIKSINTEIHKEFKHEKYTNKHVGYTYISKNREFAKNKWDLNVASKEN